MPREFVDADYSDEPAAKVIADLALLTAGAEDVKTDAPTAFVIPDGARLEVIDPARFDDLNANPRRMKGVVTPATLAALIDYVKYHADDQATSVWVASETGRVQAVINDHAGTEGAPGWGDHRAVFTPRKTPEWQRWTGADGRWLQQDEFAELLEDGLTEIADPLGATLLEVAQTMTGFSSVQWEAATRLDNGAVKAKWVEDIEAKAGARGDLEIPTKFVLVLAVFHGEEPVQIDARLRWRLRQGKLTLSFKLDNPHRAVQESVNRIAEQLRGEFPHVYVGEPR